MRIGICGSFGVGKTTLAVNLMRNSLFGGYNIDYGAEIFWRNRFPNSTYEMQRGLLLHEVRKVLKYNNYITDNPLILVAVYTDLFAKAHPESLGRDYQWLMEGVRHYYHYYDLLVHVPIETPLVVDEHRSESVEFQHDVDNTMLAELTAHNLPFITVHGTTEKRTEQVCRKVREMNLENRVLL